MKKLVLLAVLAGGSYAGWQRLQSWQDTTADVQWSAEQVGPQLSESYLVFDASPLDGRLLEVEGPGGANLLVMTSRMGYHFWKTNPELIISCRRPGARDMVNALAGMLLVSDNPKGRRELDGMVATFKERSKGGGKRPCLRLEGNQLTDQRVQFGGSIPGKLVRVTKFEALDCGDMIAGM